MRNSPSLDPAAAAAAAAAPAPQRRRCPGGPPREGPQAWSEKKIFKIRKK